MKRTACILPVIICSLVLVGSAQADQYQFTPLDYPGGLYTVARGIDGSNVVGSYVGSDTKYHGFLYDGANWTTLDHPDATDTAAWGIDGSNIVGWILKSGQNPGDRGFLYDGTDWITLEYPGSEQTAAYGIDGGGRCWNYGVAWLPPWLSL